MNVSLLIRAVDRASGPLKKVAGAARDLGGARGVGGLIARARAASQELGRLGAARSGGLRRMMSDVKALAGRAGLRGLELAAHGAGRGIGTLLRGAGGLALKGVGIATAGAGFLGGWLTGGIINLASKFEQFQVVLENTEGSAAGARKAMAWVKDFAKTTPYEVEQVMEAFVALKAYGIDPMNGTLRSLGNAASGMNKPLLQAIEMLADAQTGEFERIKEFGVRAKVTGDKVAFTYMKNGREVTATAKKSAAEIQKALIGIFDARFSGMMDRQSRTLAGLRSNIQDMLANFQLQVADAGFFDFVKGKVQALLDKVNELAANGTLTRWAKQISEWLQKAGDKAWEFATKTDWQGVARDIAGIADAILSVANAINSIPAIPDWLKRPPDIVDLWRGGALRPFGFGGGGGAPAKPTATRAPNSVMRPGQRPPSLGRAPAVRSFQAPPPLLRRQRAEVGGHIELRIQTEAGTTARVTKLASSNPAVPIDVSRGRVQPA